MPERLTDRARQVVVAAQDEARELRHDYVGTEHLLLGLLYDRETIAARALESLDVTAGGVRAQVLRIVGRGDAAPEGRIPLTGRATTALDLSEREAEALGSEEVDVEHVLLGLARLDQGVAARVLHEAGADPDRIRGEVGRLCGEDDPVLQRIERRLARIEATLEAIERRIDSRR